MFLNKTITKWDNKFLLEAVLWSRSSHDDETKCGCVIIKDKTLLSSGYNGFIRDIDDTLFPTTRPEKYPFMTHAEQNAIYNCTRLGKSTLGATAYITGTPCDRCLQALYQCGIKEIIFTDVSQPKCVVDAVEYQQIMNVISSKIEVYYIPRRNINTDDLMDSYIEIKRKGDL